MQASRSYGLPAEPTPVPPMRQPQTASIFMPFMNGRNNFLHGDIGISLPDLFSELLDLVNCRVDLLLPALCLRNQPGDAPAMARDHDGRAALDLVEQLRQMGFSLRSLHFAQLLTGIIGPKGGGVLPQSP